MFVRTLFIKNEDQEVFTAALLCSFAIPEIRSNFLVYSLNEETDANHLRIYVATLLKEGCHYALSALASDPAGQMAIRVFEQILQEASTGRRQASDTFYYLLSLNKWMIIPPLSKEHRVLNIKKARIFDLFGFQPSALFGPALKSTVASATDGLAQAQAIDRPARRTSKALSFCDSNSIFQGLDSETFLHELQATRSKRR
ncbi:hypothetical protein BK635_02900 [Pseudomonas chlororaphis]|jgi:hypothetical protein|uniref:hypothetical protein n=1 Tax=Pseudomonas chlororaphis TaxID=587753 RepID=UPI000F46C66E|nr:hypothetical protein [Pseudomonas chlororaphis]ROL89696.1 hypothetical protein BK637_10830 [Pseudomonas chlororaphis]RON90930.1 hypothetical protein BK635_02900 [Pseudomonas chlororaphis]